MKSPIAPVTPAHNLTLPESLDAVVAATLAETLSRCRGEDVTIDVRHVLWFGAQTLEILRSAELTWRTDGRKLTLSNAKASFAEDLKYFGVEPRYC